jgi:exosome complex RNA-binding protein Rrp42 (RNase PH superfamily)
MDGRNPLDSRKIDVFFGIDEPGKVEVKYGKTHIICKTNA